MGYRLHMYDDYRCLTIKCIHILPSRRESYIGGLIMVPLPEDPPPGSFALFSASHLSASGSVRRVNSQEAIVSPVSGEHICSVADSPLVISLLCPTAPPPATPHTHGGSALTVWITLSLTASWEQPHPPCQTRVRSHLRTAHRAVLGACPRPLWSVPACASTPDRREPRDRPPRSRGAWAARTPPTPGYKHSFFLLLNTIVT